MCQQNLQNRPAQRIAAGPDVYEIRVKGHLSQQRLKMYQEFAVTHTVTGETILTGPVQDQAALYDLLDWLFNLGICLLALKRLAGGTQ